MKCTYGTRWYSCSFAAFGDNKHQHIITLAPYCTDCVILHTLHMFPGIQCTSCDKLVVYSGNIAPDDLLHRWSPIWSLVVPGGPCGQVQPPPATSYCSHCPKTKAIVLISEHLCEHKEIINLSQSIIHFNRHAQSNMLLLATLHLHFSTWSRNDYTLAMFWLNSSWSWGKSIL